jgi:hypothetical protein
MEGGGGGEVACTIYLSSVGCVCGWALIGLWDR